MCRKRENRRDFSHSGECCLGLESVQNAAGAGLQY